FFNDTATTEIYTLSLHDALPIFPAARRAAPASADGRPGRRRRRRCPGRRSEAWQPASGTAPRSATRPARRRTASERSPRPGLHRPRLCGTRGLPRGKAPDRDPGRVDPGQRPGAADRGPPVGELLADALHLARLPAALAQVAVVEGQDAEPGFGEPPGEHVSSRLLGHCEAAGHDHAAAVGPGIVPGRALGVAAREPDLLSLHGYPRIDVQNSFSTEVNHVVR